jgi:hypothetical protein
MFKFASIIIILILLTSFILPDKTVLLEDFTMGKFSYSMYTKKMYIHDDEVNAVFFVVYQKGYKVSCCSSVKTAEHKGKIVTKGNYHYTSKYLEFKEYYFTNSCHADSMMKRMYPNKRGELSDLREYTEYKNGVASKEHYSSINCR